MQRKQLLKLGLAGALVFAAAAHAKPQLSVDAAGGTDLSKYTTYSWVKTSPPPGYNSVRYQRALANINTRMAAKGYRHAEPADFMLALTVGKRQKVDLDRWNRYGYHDAYARTEGEVAIDAFDAKTKKALWHGKITDIINPNKPDPAKADAALTKLLEKFPSK
jgi:Domain of unknown function (DUF4136)